MRLRLRRDLAAANRSLTEALEAVIGQQEIAIAAIYEDGFAMGRLAERIAPARGAPVPRHLSVLPGGKLTGTLSPLGAWQTWHHAPTFRASRPVQA